MMELKGKNKTHNKFKIIVGDYNTYIPMSGKNNNMINTSSIIYLYKATHTIAEYILFSSSHRTFGKIDQMLSHKTSFNIL